MKCTVLMENTAKDGFIKEHGLSFHIDYQGTSILLDGGSSGQFADNAEALGVDLAGVKWGALSHGHYDHADGLRRFFKLNQKAPVYLRPTAWGAYYSLSSGSPHFVGIHRELWDYNRERFVPVEGIFQPQEGVWLLPETVTGGPFAGQEKTLVRKLGEDDFVPDDFSHEQSLVFETAKGLVVFNSCAHGGVINIINGIMAQLPGKRIYAFLGGLHMMGPGGAGMNCTPDYVQAVSRELIRLGVEKLYTGHCTGDMACALLKEHLGERMSLLTGGLTLEFEDGTAQSDRPAFTLL